MKQTTPTRKVSFWHRLFDLMSPRACAACNARLAESEEVLCCRCNLHLPRTGFAANAYDNEMAQCFWGRIAIERAAALFFYQPHAESGLAIYDLKYHRHPDYARSMGLFTAREFASNGFFDGIDAIVPIPLARVRQRERGYNQAEELARGVAEATGLPILAKAIRRNVFTGSLTQVNRQERTELVEGVFELRQPEKVADRHLLIVDDVVTTGATICSCGQELMKASNVKLSVLSLGFTKS